jgi:methionyl-tRNA formyltransferase
VVFAGIAAAGTRALLDVLDQLADGSATWTAQPAEGATYAHKITAADRVLDLTAPTRAVHDRVRALSPHIGAWLNIDDARCGIWRSRCLEQSPAAGQPGAVWHDEQSLHLGTSDGAIEVLELQPAGRTRMPAQSWLQGLRAPVVRASTPVVGHA